MQVILDIPEPWYRELQDRAAATHKSLEQMLLEQVFGPLVPSDAVLQRKRRRVQLPMICAGEPGNLDLYRNLNDAFFDDFDPA